MKECPVCHALAFDDAARCFGCLHVFGKKEGEPRHAVPQESVREHESARFLLSLIPTESEEGLRWKCSVELVGSEVS